MVQFFSFKNTKNLSKHTNLFSEIFTIISNYSKLFVCQKKEKKSCFGTQNKTKKTQNKRLTPQQTSESDSASTNSSAPPHRQSLAEPALLFQGEPSKRTKTAKAIAIAKKRSAAVVRVNLKAKAKSKAVLEERRIAAESAPRASNKRNNN